MDWQEGRTMLFLPPRVSCSDSFAVPNEVVRGGFPRHTHTSMALCCRDTAHGATCVFAFVQKEYNCHANHGRMAANSVSCSQGFSGWDFATTGRFSEQSDLISGLYWALSSRFTLMPKPYNVFFFFYTWLCSVGAGVFGPAPVLYWRWSP